MANSTNFTTLSANSKLSTDFSVEPYYDDYDVTKNFYRILYRPGYAVQARELTQSQTILQNQIDRFGKHVFKEGSLVIPGQYSIELDVDYVKINDVDASNNTVTLSEFVGETLTATSNIKAYVIDVVEGTQTSSNTKTLYIRYTSGTTSNTDLKFFNDNENLVSSNAKGTLVSISANSVGKGSRFIITEGVFFAKQHFIYFPTQSIILDRYSSSPTCKVGFNLQEKIVRYTDDSSLLDPALESSNFSAPGADRLALIPTLTKYDYDEQTDSNFVELFRIKDGVITELYERSQYNILQDELAKRTLDESGDYYVSGLNIRLRENLDINNNEGYDANGDANLLSVGVETGTAYVKGYEVTIRTPIYVTTEKSLDYSNTEGQFATTTVGSYIKTNEFTGVLTLDVGTTILLKDAASQRLTTGKWASSAASGNTIGTAIVKSAQYNSGTLGTPSGNVDVFLCDIKMNGTNSFANVRSITATNFGADIVVDGNNAVLKATSDDTLLYFVGSSSVRNIKTPTGNPSIDFFFNRTSDVTIATVGTTTVTVSTTGESTPYGTTGSLSDTDKREIIFNIKEDANLTLTGTVSANSGSGNTYTLTGSGTTFTNLNVGDKLEIAGKSNTFFIASITDATALTVTTILPPSLTGNTYFKAYKNGDVIDLTTKGVSTGATRVVSTTSSSITVDLKESFSSSKTASITYPVSRSNSKEIKKNLRANRYVIINCATAGTSGPFNLGFSDVYQIRNIIKKTGSAPANLSDGTDVSSSFTLDNGQKDSFYDHANITPNITLGATDYLLVHLDFFEPDYSQGVGYFSIDSYPINDTTSSNTSIRTENIPFFVSPSKKVSYELRNYLDFRPVKVNTATSTTNPASASTNPGTTSTFNSDGVNGLRFPKPSSEIQYDYSSYLARNDIVVIDKNKIVSIVKGTSAERPVTPITPENGMALATLFIAPYPSLAPNYAQKIGKSYLSSSVKKTSNIRYTMRDIGILKQRIANLETYATLNLLEKAALELTIRDENGNDRFKNGIFVDPFKDHVLGDIANPDYRIVVDRQEQSIRPVYNMSSIYYDYISGSNVTKSRDLVTLPYSNVVLIDQPNVTTERNIEISSYRFVGSIELDPPFDVWVDTDKMEDNVIRIGDHNTSPQVTTTEWNDWQTKIVGYEVERAPDYFWGGNPRLRGLVPTAEGGFYNSLPGTWVTAVWSNDARTPTVYGSLIAESNGYDQKVTEISSATRTGIETTYTTTGNEATLGSRVVNVDLVPYIKPQTIKVKGQGLKPLTKVFVYFDGENLSDYVTPVSKATWDLVSPVTSGSFRINIITSGEGQTLITDTDGYAYFLLRLPTEKRFTIGTKEIIITDSPTNASDATTTAKGYFVAQGMVQQKQDTILSTRNTVKTSRPVTETSNKNVVIGYLDQPSCTAYSFIPKTPNDIEGVFLTAVDLYVSRKHPTYGIWVEIREMDNAGGITRNQVPMSEVWIPSSSLTISPDGYTSPHTITFPNPVFLYNDKQYAFVIHTIGLNPDTYLWVSRLGEKDLQTSKVITSRPLTGTVYTTNNNLNWDIVPDIDLKIKFYRASFDTTVSGTAYIGNKNSEKLLLSNASGSFTEYGEALISNFRITLASNTSIIANGDILIGQNTGARAVVLSNAASPVFVTSVANTDFLTTERVEIFNSSNVSKSNTSAISAIDIGSGVVDRYTTYKFDPVIELRSSNGKFTIGDTVKGSISQKTATISAIQNYRYSTIDFEPSYINFNKSAIDFSMLTTSNSGVQDTTYTNLTPGQNYYFDVEKAVLSRTNEISTISGDRSNKVKINMSTNSEYVSPVLDIGRTHTIYVDNIINNDITGETGAKGNLVNKYISQVVTLAEGQDAEDLLVNITAYIPPGSDVDVWIKILNGEDSDTITQRDWIAMEKVYNRTASSLSNRNDFKDYKYSLPVSYMTGPATDNSPGGEVQYTNSQGIVFTGYKYFQVKIGLRSTNSAIVPRVADLRCIALQI